MSFERDYPGYELHTEGRRQGIIRFISSTYQQYYRLRAAKGLYDEEAFMDLNFRKAAKMVWEDRAMYATTANYMITVNPPTNIDVEWETLLRLWNKVRNSRNLLCHPEMVLEQRSEDVTAPLGYHMHIACKVGSKPISQVRQRIYQLYVSCIGDHGPQVIDTKSSPKAYSYVNGLKKPDKQKKMLVDRILREKKSLQHIYKHNAVQNKNTSRTPENAPEDQAQETHAI